MTRNLYLQPMIVILGFLLAFTTMDSLANLERQHEENMFRPNRFDANQIFGRQYVIEIHKRSLPVKNLNKNCKPSKKSPHGSTTGELTQVGPISTKADQRCHDDSDCFGTAVCCDIFGSGICSVGTC